MSKEEILKEMGWSVTCESPYEITYEDGSFASGLAAQYATDGIISEFKDEQDDTEKNKFIREFAITFMATWVVKEYDSACFSGEHERLYNPQIEDAYHIAEKVWVNKKEILS